MEIYNEKYLREGDKISVEKKADCAVYRLSNAGGSGRITEYEIFEDVSVLFDDMHLESFGEGTRGAYALHIEHCKQGRFEAAFSDGRRFYLGAGDICVHNIDYGDIAESSMPYRHYHGITIMIKSAKDERFRELLAAIGVDFEKIAADTTAAGGLYIIRATERIEHIFDELYRVTPQNRTGYFKLKLLELLLFLSGTKHTATETQKHFLPKENADLLKKVELYLWENISLPLTIPRLSEIFGISPTSLKSGFRILYGCPIHAYLNICRMQTAAYKLVKTQEKIADIARQTGYKSESKFSKSFVRFSGKTPRDYRKDAILSDWSIISPVRV